MNYFIGIDGGGTATKATLIDENENEIDSTRTGPGNYRAVGVQATVNNVTSAITELIKKNNISPDDVKHLYLGLASVDTPKDKQLLMVMLDNSIHTAAGLHCPYQLDNDTVVALRSGSTNPNAILIIMGTGSNCLGKDDQGQIVWSGGLDYILSDEASGYELGVKALRAAVRSEDGRDPQTKIEQIVKRMLDINSMREAKNIVYEYNKHQISDFSKCIFDAHSLGDQRAIEILNETTDEAVLMVKSAYRQLDFQDKNVDIVFVGGITKHPVIQSLLTDKLSPQFPKAAIIFPEKSASFGAALMAKDAYQASGGESQ
jgi:N-acetylglucosamine kinase-like BadF-type ATPase